MTAFLAVLKSAAVDWLAGIAGELFRQWRHDRTVKQNAILKAQLKSRKAIDRAQKTVSERDLSAIRERLRGHAGRR